MGGSTSKTTAMDPNSITKQSSGFHILEVHAPSLALGITSVAISTVIVVVLIWCLQSRKKLKNRKTPMDIELNNFR